MATGGDRVDGWKAIGAYLGRDRTTVIRWANERGLPVHAIPGGKTRSVYALKGELDAWRASPGSAAPAALPASSATPHVATTTVQAPPPELALTPSSPPTRRNKRRGLVVIGATILFLLGLMGWWQWHVRPSGIALPKDPVLARRYIDARDEVARRDTHSLAHALSELQAITIADPGFAGAQASLADAYVLAREYGSLDDPAAMPLIERAARRALALDPGQASAERALAFVAYWWKGDARAAAEGFQRAIAKDDDDGLTHLWYANILADNGDAAAAAREFNAAKLLLPGMPSVRIDEAWAIWSAGNDRLAETNLLRLAQQNPTLAAPHDCLSIIALARGDLTGYALEVARRAALRGERSLFVYAAAVRTAVTRGDIDRLAALMIDRAGYPNARADADMALVAFLQSSLGQRGALLKTLQRADRLGHRWRGAGFRLHIARRWRGDATILRLLARRAPSPLVGRAPAPTI